MNGMKVRGFVLFTSVFCWLALTAGCARTPSGVTRHALNQLVVQVTMSDNINPNYTYFVAFNATSGADTAHGPLPVVSYPWGNGWGAGVITHYVQVGGRQPLFYGLYKFPQTGDPSKDLVQSSPANGLLAYDNFQGGRTFSFTLDLDQLLTASGVPATSLNVNIIATDIVPIDPDDRSSKQVDALGAYPGNDFVTIPLEQGRTFRNQDSLQPEAEGDAGRIDPSLDIKDWQIDVRRS